MIEHLYYWIKSYSMRICGTGYHTIRPKAWKLCRRKPFSSEKVHNFKMSRVQKFYGNMEKWHFQKLTLYSERYTGRKDYIILRYVHYVIEFYLGPQKVLKPNGPKRKFPSLVSLSTKNLIVTPKLYISFVFFVRIFCIADGTHYC